MRGIDTFLAIKPQVDLLTPQPTSALAVGDFLAFNSESLTGAQQIITNPAIRRQAMRSRAFSAMGTMEAGGGVEFTASNLVLNSLLPLIFHANDSGDVASAAGRVYSLQDGGVLTPFTAFVGMNGPEGAYTRIFSGAKVNSATFSARVNDMLRLNLNVAAIEKTLEDGAVTAEYQEEDEYAFVYDQASVKLMAGDMAALAEIPVESFDLNLNHNLDTNAYRLGSAYRRSLQEGVTDVDGTFTLDAASKAVGGGGLDLGGTGTHDPAFWERVARNAVFAALEFTLVDPTHQVAESVPGAGDGTPSTLKIELPYVRLEEPGFNVSDAGLITGSARFVAYDSITATHIADLGA